jgi:hypothetical protein
MSVELADRIQIAIRAGLGCFFEESRQFSPGEGFFYDEEQETAQDKAPHKHQGHQDEVPGPVTFDDKFGKNEVLKDVVDEEIMKKVNRVAHHSDGDDPAVREEFSQDWAGQDGKGKRE